MAQLAKQDAAGTITRLEEIAQREAVSANFLVQILNDLRRAGLIVSKRGKLGGYHLGRTQDDITLFDIVHAVEPSILVPSSTTDGESGQPTATAWEKVSNSLSTSLKSIKLRELTGESENPMFYI